MTVGFPPDRPQMTPYPHVCHWQHVAGSPARGAGAARSCSAVRCAGSRPPALGRRQDRGKGQYARVGLRRYEQQRRLRAYDTFTGGPDRGKRLHGGADWAAPRGKRRPLSRCTRSRMTAAPALQSTHRQSPRASVPGRRSGRSHVAQPFGNATRQTNRIARAAGNWAHTVFQPTPDRHQ